MVEEVRRNKRSALCFKVDYEKVYDSVRWDFLFDMLQKLGFHSKWVRWVRGCLESSSISMLVNGSPTEEFKPSRGLRQGDPMAPFLFLVVAEGLVGLVRQASKQNMLTGVKVGRREIECSMLQFADDTLFLCEDSFLNVFTIKTILRCFELVYGLKINFYKSKLVGINVDKFTLETYAKTLNCNTMRIPFKYLGLEVGGNPRKVQFWEPVVNKVSARLSTWKGRCLSMAGRICLIKSVFTSIPLFYLSWFQQAITWNVKSGDLVRFWEDPWVNNKSLKELYPRLFSISLNQGMKVGETGYWDSFGWRWNLNWRRERFHWESILEDELLEVLHRVVMHEEAKDFISWNGDPKGFFSVRSAYDLLANQGIRPSYDVFRLLWKTKAFPKALVITWRILLDRIPTRQNLVVRGIMVNSPLCVLCNQSVETTQHLFLDCIFAYRVWMLCYTWIGVMGAHNRDLCNHFMNFHDGYPRGEDFINEGRGFSPTHLKFFLLVFSQI